jgi:site-specific DNA-cytosine methylase
MNSKINVLSLFDGMSCGQIALERTGIGVENYFASEIDKYAIKVTMANYPNTKQLGDIRNIKGNALPKIDLLIGGSPCQGFSFAGKQLNFDDPRSALFFEYVRILNELKEINPDIKFLLENVRMKKEYQDIINNYLNVEPIEINSNLVSAQNRTRFYWSNIEGIELPKDKNILLQSILESNEEILDKYKVPFTPSRVEMWNGKCKNITNATKSSCVVTKQDRWNNQGLIAYKDFCRFLTPIELERLQTVPDNYTSCVRDKERDFMLGNGWTVDVIKHIFSYL